MSNPDQMVVNTPNSSESRRFPIWLFGLGLALAAGAALRLLWGLDLEYKADERFTFEYSQEIGVSRSWPWLGMPTSAGPRNPGMSLWVFLGLTHLSGAEDPVTLARAVQVLNLIALLAMVAFVFAVVPVKEREPWLWAVALVCLNPLQILFHRKIWPPSILLIFMLALLVGWYRRERSWGAFSWGLMGVIMGQIHISGFFLTAGFALWAFLFDRKSVRWGAWICGCALAILPMLPWIWHVATYMGEGSSLEKTAWTCLFEFRFWLRWVTEPFGLWVSYSLGKDFGEFLSWPLLVGQPTYGMLALHGLVILLAVAIFIRWGQVLWQERSRWQDWITGRSSATAFTLAATVWGFGLLLTLSTKPVFRHYVVVAVPLGFVWLARVALASNENHSARLRLGRAMLLTLCLTQGLISWQFFTYIHNQDRTIAGDFWMPYRVQLQTGYQPAMVEFDH